MDLIVKPTELCNFKCTFCSSSKITENDNTAQLDLLKIFRFLDRFPDTQTIIVNGGDPLMMDPKYYMSIIEFLDKNNYPASISLTTNLWPFYKKPEKWLEIFQNPRVGIATSFQYGGGRLKGDFSEFTEEDFWKCSDAVLKYCGYRPSFIAVIVEENEDTVIKTVELAKKMDVVCKVNYAMASGEQSAPYVKGKMYKGYVDIWKAGLADWEHNTQTMMVKLKGHATVCPVNRDCDAGIRTLQPEGDYYSCGAFGDDMDKAIDFEREMAGEFFTPLREDLHLNNLKQSCFTCPMFQICNGCRKTVKDLKEHNLVEEHCLHMKSIAEDIIEANGMTGQLTPTPYVKEYF
ncbi:MAG: radical SAM protein [Methylophagaceae bacterium]|jgi:radical SAM protein with 4Fe4S-binding SPASM domain